MIISLALLVIAKAVEIDKRELIVSKTDLNLFIQTGVLEEATADLVWNTLIIEAQKNDPSRISMTGFNKSETYLFGVIPILSFIISVGSFGVLMLLFWLMGMVEGFKMNFILVGYAGLSSLITITLSFTLYESFGVVIVTWLLMMAGLYSLILMFETILIMMKLIEEEHSYSSFNPYIAGVLSVVGLISYYYSLLMGFPLFQVPFYIAFWYLVGFFQSFLEKKYKYLQNFPAFLLTSVLLIFYMFLSGQSSFILLGNFQFVDFRFLGLVSSSLAYLGGLPLFLYKFHCTKHNIPEEPVENLITKFFSLEVTTTWTEINKLCLVNLIGMAFFLFFGFLARSVPMIITGFVGSLLSMTQIPVNRYSNLFYHLMYLSTIMISAILAYVNDPTFHQFLVFYPKSYLMTLAFLAIRVVLVIFGLLTCSKFRVSHFVVHSSSDFMIDFVFSYFQTVILLVFSENESNFLMSWAYFLFSLVSLEPVVKIAPESLTDNILKAFSMLLFAARLASIGYSSWVMMFNSLFILLVGLVHLNNETSSVKILKYAKIFYVFLCFQFACGLKSWIFLAFVAGGLRVNLDFQVMANSQFTQAALPIVFFALLSFFVDIGSICAVTPGILDYCNVLVNVEGSFLERQVLEKFLGFLNGNLA
jgi:hypothetical protein